MIGGGLGLRLGEPYARAPRARHAPAPVRLPPTARVPLAPLGDLGGAIGAALLASESETARA